MAFADMWTQHGESIRTLHDLHGSLCEEMVKDISNNELRRATEATALGWPSLDDLAPELGRLAALVVEAIVRAWTSAER